MPRLSVFDSPLLLGFDHFERVLDRVAKTSHDGYPPYNIEVSGEDSYRVTMAVAGFGEEDLNITVKENVLYISGNSRKEDEGTVYLHRGIAGRSFERRFHLAEHIQVKGAKLENGILYVDLVREVPEALKPRKVEISTKGKAKGLTQQAA